jgi:hypothetical protein
MHLEGVNAELKFANETHVLDALGPLFLKAVRVVNFYFIDLALVSHLPPNRRRSSQCAY